MEYCGWDVTTRFCRLTAVTLHPCMKVADGDVMGCIHAELPSHLSNDVQLCQVSTTCESRCKSCQAWIEAYLPFARKYRNAMTAPGSTSAAIAYMVLQVRALTC